MERGSVRRKRARLGLDWIGFGCQQTLALGGVWMQLGSAPEFPQFRFWRRPMEAGTVSTLPGHWAAHWAAQPTLPGHTSGGTGPLQAWESAGGGAPAVHERATERCRQSNGGT